MDGFTYGKTIESIRKYGFIDPMTVRYHPVTPGAWQIIDGENRWRAARDLGLIEGPAFSLGDIPDSQAQQLTVVLNELRGQYDPSSMGSLLKTLLENDTIEELTKTLPFTEDALKGLVGLKDFDWGSLGSTPPAHADPQSTRTREKWVERTFRLTVEANGVLQQALDKVKDGESITDAQALELLAADFIA